MGRRPHGRATPLSWKKSLKKTKYFRKTFEEDTPKNIMPWVGRNCFKKIKKRVNFENIIQKKKMRKASQEDCKTIIGFQMKTLQKKTD